MPARGPCFSTEICSLPIALQSKLLRVLEEKTITPLGSNTSIPVKARIIAATKQGSGAGDRQRDFRQDLYFRLNVLPIRIQPLRERKEDIPLLVEFFRQEYGYGKMQAPAPFAPETIREICSRPWPGNVRELRNHVRRLCILGSIEHNDTEDRGKNKAGAEPGNGLPLKAYMDKTEKDYIEATLRSNGGQVVPTCSQLGISRKTFYDKVNRFAIDLKSFRASD